MLSVKILNVIITISLSVVILVCSIGIVLASQFQRKKDKKYKEVLRIIKEKEKATFEVKNGLTSDEVRSIDNSIDANILMQELYNTFLEFINKTNNLETNFDDVLTGTIKEMYESKIASSKEKHKYEVTDGIELIGYSIMEFKNDSLVFRLNINCFNYRMSKGTVISGSNLEKVEQILIITYEKVNDKWLISKLEHAYEAKLNK